MADMRRVCDACYVRRVKCNGQSPCAGCEAADLECSRLRPRYKPGPKTIRNLTRERIHAARRRRLEAQEGSVSEDLFPTDSFDAFARNNIAIDSAALQSPEPLVIPSGQDHAERDDSSIRLQEVSVSAIPMSGHRISVEALGLYLDIYHHKLFPVWPIVDFTSLTARLRDSEPDLPAYMLAASVCAATILQLQLALGDTAGSLPKPQCIVSEIEDLRKEEQYREHPTLDSLSTSFFLHVVYLHLDQRMTSTLMLREAASMAHLLNLQNPAHYEGLPGRDVQDHLRKLWLLFITERAHSNQYDLPCIMSVSPKLPVLNDAGQPYTLSAFVSLCRMFALFDKVASQEEHTAQTLVSMHSQLQAIPALTPQYNAIQRADLFVTRQWMRLILWKTAVAHIKMGTDPSGNLESMLFPMQVARVVVKNMADMSIDTLEAHGPGMELKLFSLAASVADVMTCLPPHSTCNTGLQPQETLHRLASVLATFRGGNNRLLPILQSRLADVGLSAPAIPRVFERFHDEYDGEGTWPSSGSNEVSGRDFHEDEVLPLPEIGSSHPSQTYDGSLDNVHGNMVELW